MKSSPIETKYVNAAITAFAAGGFYGTTMHDIARVAGVSQPRISQVFDGKESAFLAAHARAAELIVAALSNAASTPYDQVAMNKAAFSLLMDDRQLMMIILHATMVTTPLISATCRETVGVIMTILVDECQATAQQATEFMATGFFAMMLSANGLFDHLDDHRGLKVLADGLAGANPAASELSGNPAQPPTS